MEEKLIEFFIPLFIKGNKKESEHCLGCEYEKFGFFRKTHLPIPYKGEKSIYTLLNIMVDRGWSPQREGETIISLSKDGSNITIEPGGQIELSARPFRTLEGCKSAFKSHIAELVDCTRDWDVIWFAGGVIPHLPLERVTMIPKQRYQIMDRYLAAKGSLAHHMMRMSQSVQTSIDYSSEEDGCEKFRVAQGIAPLVTAIFANSPFINGKESGYHCYRQKIWQETDPERCGIIDSGFRDDFSFRDYIRYALNVPMMFKKSAHSESDCEWFPLPGTNLITFLSQQPQERWNEIFTLHLTGIFTMVRLKTYVETRSVDCVPEPFIHCISALWKGIMYDDDARQAAWELVAKPTLEDRRKFHKEVAISSIHARFMGYPVRELGIELLSLAREGLRRQGLTTPEFFGEERELDPIESLLKDGLNPALLWMKEMKNTLYKDEDFFLKPGSW